MDYTLTDAGMWALIVAFASPLVLAIVQQPRWSAAVRAVVTVLFSALAGTLTAYFAGAFTGRNVVSTILLVLVATIVFYKGFWKPTGVAPGIESATSGSRVR
jgi:hypothetical protein